MDVSIDVPAWLGIALLVVFVVTGAFAGARARHQPYRPVGSTERPLYGIWLVSIGTLGLTVAVVIFVACSANGYDGDPGVVVATAFDVGLWGGMVAMLAGAAWGMIADVVTGRAHGVRQ